MPLRPGSRTVTLIPSCGNSIGGSPYSFANQHAAPLVSDENHSASPALTTNQPSVTGASPEPASSSLASFTNRILAVQVTRAAHMFDRPVPSSADQRVTSPSRSSPQESLKGSRHSKSEAGVPTPRSSRCSGISDPRPRFDVLTELDDTHEMLARAGRFAL